MSSNKKPGCRPLDNDNEQQSTKTNYSKSFLVENPMQDRPQHFLKNMSMTNLQISMISEDNLEDEYGNIPDTTEMQTS